MILLQCIEETAKTRQTPTGRSQPLVVTTTRCFVCQALSPMHKLLYGPVLAVLMVLPRLSTEALKSHGLHPLIPVGCIAVVATLRSLDALRGTPFLRDYTALPLVLLGILIVCDGIGDVLLVLGTAFPSMRLADVQVVSRCQAGVAVVLGFLGYVAGVCERPIAGDVLAAVLSVGGVLLFLQVDVVAGQSAGGPPAGAVACVVLSRVAAEATGFAERAALVRGLSPAHVLLLTNAFVPLLFVGVAFSAGQLFDVGVVSCAALLFGLTECSVVGGVYAFGLLWLAFGPVVAALLVFNVAAAVAFLTVRMNARAHGMTNVHIAAWTSVAFVASVVVSAASTLTLSQWAGVALVTAGVLSSSLFAHA